MRIKNWSLKEFARHARKYWPQACKEHKLPTEGCMPAVEDWLKATGIGIPGFLAKLKTADGDRAMVLFWCAYHGWIPRAEAVELIKTAPGNQAWALYYCADCCWLPSDQAVELIKSAPGDRASVLQWCADQGWITKAEVENYLETQ
jgi:hypothetical protein